MWSECVRVRVFVCGVCKCGVQVSYCMGEYVTYFAGRRSVKLVMQNDPQTDSWRFVVVPKSMIFVVEGSHEETDNTFLAKY